MSVLLFHPSVAPFVQHAAAALHEAGQLDRFVTTVRDDPDSILQRAAGHLSAVLGGDLRSRFRRRAVTEVPADKVESRPWGELLRLSASMIDIDGRLTDLVWEWAETGFDRGVAARLPPGLTGVYGFEHSSLATFRRARQLGLRVAYDVPAPEAGFVKQLLDREMERFPELRTNYDRHTDKRDPRRIARRHEEWKCADVVITASRFTRDSYAAAGLDVGKAKIVPYGAPPVVATSADMPATERPTFVCAGTFSIRKGAHYLLDAWRQGNLGRHARLLVFGAVALPERVLRPLPDGVELRGSIPRDALLGEMHRADALVFPTLCDGFGMVATEAWACGLPVITTDRAGASDQLRHEENGLLIRAGDTTAIREALEWCLVQRPRLRAMREAAAATAAHWQWSDYRRALATALREAGFFDKP